MRAGTHDRIRAAALKLFAMHGFQGTGIRQIADEAGISVATLYHYMITKEDLLAELMRDSMRHLLDPARTMFAEVTDPLDRIVRLVDLHVRKHAAENLLSLVGDTEIRSLSPPLRRQLVGLGFPLAIFLFLGASTPAPMAEETSSPRRGVPLAIFGATFLAIAIYVFMSWAENVGFNGNTHSLVQASYPFLTAAGNAAGPLKDVMYIAGFTSAVAVLLTAGNPTSRVWFNMAREGVLPRWFGQVHPRFRTPTRVIVLFVSIEMIITLVVGFSIGADSGFSDLASAGTIGAVILFIAVNFALTTYFAKTRRDMFSIPRHVIAPSLGTIAFAYPLYETVKPNQASPFNWFGVMWLVLLAVSIGYGVLAGHRVRLGQHLADDEEVPNAPVPGAGPLLGGESG